MDAAESVNEGLLKLFEFYDSDSDGILTKEEKLAADGKISKALGSTGGAMRTDTFAKMDADGSGDVDSAEFIASWKEKYAAYPPEMQKRMLDTISEIIS